MEKDKKKRNSGKCYICGLDGAPTEEFDVKNLKFNPIACDKDNMSGSMIIEAPPDYFRFVDIVRKEKTKKKTEAILKDISKEFTIAEMYLIASTILCEILYHECCEACAKEFCNKLFDLFDNYLGRGKGE